MRGGRSGRRGRGGREQGGYYDEADLHRNCLSIRFKDAEHQAVVDEAWRNRKTASGWLRELVLEHLARKGIYNPLQVQAEPMKPSENSIG